MDLAFTVYPGHKTREVWRTYSGNLSFLAIPQLGDLPQKNSYNTLNQDTIKWRKQELNLIGVLAKSTRCLWKWSRSVVSEFATPWTEPTRLLHPWDFPGKSTGVGCHFLLQEIFLTQGLNPGLPHCRQTLYHLSHQGSPCCPLKVRECFFRRFLLGHVRCS